MAKVRRLTGGVVRSKKSAVVDVVLPTARSVPSTRIGDYTFLIYGEKKIGKTSLAARFPRPLFLFTEPGGKGLRTYSVACASWPVFRGAVKQLRGPDGARFRTVFVDTVDNLYDMCFAHVCGTLAIDHPSEEDWGKGWDAIKREFAEGLSELLTWGGGVGFLSHAAVSDVTDRKGKTHHRIGTTMKKAAGAYLEAVVDVWAYYRYEGKRRALQIGGDDMVSAGSRCEGNFKTTDGRPVRVIDMGQSASEAYAALTAAFNNQQETPDPFEADEGGTGDHTTIRRRKVDRK